MTDPNARKEWDAVIVPAIERGQITIDDRALAIGRCNLWAKYLRLLVEETKHPDIVGVGKNKHPILNPAGIGADKTLERLAKISAELGLTVVSRTRVEVKPRETSDPLDRFLKKR